MMLYVLILAQLISGLFADAERDRLRHLSLQLEKVQQSPLTEFRLVNRSGKPIDAVLMDCSADPMKRPCFQEYTKRVGPYGQEPTPLHRVRWSGAFMLKSVTLVRGDQKDECDLSFTCKPGVRVLVVVDAKGKVTAEDDN